MFHSKREYFFLTYLIGITRNAVAVAHEVTAAAVLRLHPIVDRVSVHRRGMLAGPNINLVQHLDNSNSCTVRHCLQFMQTSPVFTLSLMLLLYDASFILPRSGRARWNLLRPSILPIEVFSPALIFKLSQCHMLGLLHHSLTHSNHLCLLLLPCCCCCCCV